MKPPAGEHEITGWMGGAGGTIRQQVVSNHSSTNAYCNHSSAGGTAYQHAGTAFQDGGTAFQHAGTAFQDGGTAFQHAGTALQDGGTAFQHVSTAFQHAGTAFQHVGTAFKTSSMLA